LIGLQLGFFRFRKVEKDDNTTDGKATAVADDSTIKATAGNSTG